MCGRSPTDQMKDLDVDSDMGKTYVCHSSSCSLSGERIHRKCAIYNDSTHEIFEQVTERLITDQTEITGLTTTDWQQPMWRETTLLTDIAVQFATAKTYVFSDSVLCLGGISTEPVKAWEGKIKWFFGNTSFLRIGSDRRRTKGIRDSKDDDWIKV